MAASTLNIMCAICSEFYKTNDVVFSTTICGHLFHYQCITRWLKQSNTCPQCRKLCHRNRIHRIYLNFGERTSLDDEMEAAAWAAEANMPQWIPLLDPELPGHPEPVPEGAIKAGSDHDGNDAYVARAYLHEDLLPANYVPQKGGAYTPWNCRAHLLREGVEVLLDCDCEWVTESYGNIPPNAIVTGYSETGENLYTGRAKYEGIILPGKVHPSHKVMYMPYNGKEVNANVYEVLVLKPKKKEQQQSLY